MDKVELVKAFTTLAGLQDSMNAKVNPSWRHSNYPFWRAIWTEVGEATGYIQWAWWKALGPKTIATRHAQLQFNLEMADVLHFGISQYLQSRFNDRDGIDNQENQSQFDCEELAEYFADSYEHAVNRTAQRGIPLIELLEQVAYDALGSRHFDTSSFFAAAYVGGLSGPALIAYYHGKNVLNMFRQEHGYKQGDYIKNWGTDANPVEDNVALAELIEDYRQAIGEQNLLPKINNGSFKAFLQTNLATQYSRLVAD